MTQIKLYRIRPWLVFLIRFKFVTTLNHVRLHFANCKKHTPLSDAKYIKEGIATENSISRKLYVRMRIDVLAERLDILKLPAYNLYFIPIICELLYLEKEMINTRNIFENK